GPTRGSTRRPHLAPRRAGDGSRGTVPRKSAGARRGGHRGGASRGGGAPVLEGGRAQVRLLPGRRGEPVPPPREATLLPRTPAVRRPHGRLRQVDLEGREPGGRSRCRTGGLQ